MSLQDVLHVYWIYDYCDKEYNEAVITPWKVKMMI